MEREEKPPDKSGSFPVLSPKIYRDRAQVAMSGLFKPSEVNLWMEQKKKKLISLLREGDFESVSKAVKEEKENFCFKKLSVKDHKSDYPYMVVVNESRPW